jgi:hypothetical protein
MLAVRDGLLAATEDAMSNVDRAEWRRHASQFETDQLSVGMSALVILVLSALCWGVVISMAMELASLF